MRLPPIAFGILIALAVAPSSGQGVPEAITARGVPPIPADLALRTEKYRRIPGNSFAGWFGGRRELLLKTGTERTTQVFCVVHPEAPWTRLTHFKERVADVQPRPGRNQFLLTRDHQGDENDQLALFDTPTARTRRLTNDHVRHDHARWSPDGRLLAWSNPSRTGKDLDVYVADLAVPGSTRRLVEVSGRATTEDWSPDGRRLAVLKHERSDRTRISLVDVKSGREEPVDLQPGASHPPGVKEVRWAKDGRSLYVTTDLGSEFLRLVRYDLTSKSTTVLTGSIPWDVDAFDLSDDGRAIALVVNEDGLAKLHLLDTATGRERPGPHLAAGQISHLAFRPGSREFAFNLNTAGSSSHIYSYIEANKQLVRWTRGAPGGLGFAASEPEAFRYPSFDGKRIPAFLYRPRHRADGPCPVVIDLHGGPASQFRPGFLGAWNALLDELGIALIFPNVRGSTGYGQTYQGLDDGLRREDAVKDVGALLDWIATRPDLDASRVAVSGGSYGGYLTLATLIRYGDRLRAGIDVAGFSDFVTLIESQSDLRRDGARAEFGDERNSVVNHFLKSISPLAGADRIRVPLLVAQGANDPRVPVAEAEQIVAEVRRNGGTVWYVLARDEGHGFTRRANLDYLELARFLFLKRYLIPLASPGG